MSLALASFVATPCVVGASAISCETLFGSVKNVGTKTDLQSQLDRIETRLKEAGLSFSDLKLSLRRGEALRFSITHGEDELVYGSLRPKGSGPHAGRISIENIRVSLGHVGHGLGTLAFLILAREAARTGYVLESSWDQTDSYKKIWQRLVAKGWARRVDSLFSEFRPEFLDAPETVETLDQIIERMSTARDAK